MSVSVRQYKGQVNVYRIVFDIGTDTTGQRRRTSEIFRGSESAAKRRGRHLLAKVEQGVYVARGPETFGAFIDAWWPAKSASVAPTTARGYRQMLDRYILPALATRPIQKITGSELSAIIGRLVKADHLPMADHTYVLLRVIFNAAMKQGAIGRSPLPGVERPRVERREMTVLSPADWQRMRDQLQESAPWTVRPMTILLTTGMRRSELCGLQWRDVELERAVLYVRRSYHVIDGRGIFKEPKSTRSRRAIALDVHSVKLLADQRADATRFAGMFGRKLAETAPVFANARGEPWSPDSLTAVWRRSAAAIGLPSHLHSLRHSSATLMLAAGVPIQLVSARLGHANAGFTLSVYAGFLPGAQAEAAEKLGALLNGHALPAGA